MTDKNALKPVATVTVRSIGGDTVETIPGRDYVLAQDAAAIIAAQSAALELAKVALGELQDLIGESSGVYGLHLNGDESPWSEIEQGGRFERLITLPEALAAIEALPAAPKGGAE